MTDLARPMEVLVGADGDDDDDEGYVVPFLY